MLVVMGVVLDRDDYQESRMTVNSVSDDTALMGGYDLGNQ